MEAYQPLFPSRLEDEDSSPLESTFSGMRTAPEMQTLTGVGPRHSNNAQEELDELDVALWTGHMYQEAHRKTHVEPLSVWGAAFVIPQVARCIQCNALSMVLIARAFFNLFCCVAVQLCLVVFMGKSTQVFAPLGGHMHLCDFGSNLDACPDAPNCIGPGGTNYTSHRLLKFEKWMMQRFAKDAFLYMHSDRHDEIKKSIDPGEYGLESYKCRVMCVVLFVTSVVPEIVSCLSMAICMYNLERVEHDEPGGSWAELDHEVQAHRTTYVSMAGRTIEQEKYTYRFAGMPLRWKVFNFLFLLCPKVMILHYVLREGSVMLMETSDIKTMILGAMALSYLTSMNDMFYNHFATEPVRRIMFSIRAHNDDEEVRTDVKAYEILFRFFPWRSCMVLIVATIYIAYYYYTKCHWKGGQFVSKDMYIPVTSSYHILDFMLDSLFHTLGRSDKSFWTFASVHSG
jgi:hypothetical protein